MYANSTGFTPFNSGFTQATSPGSQPSPSTPLLHQLHTSIQPPILKNKPAQYAGLPDQSDRASMRERRDQSQMTLSELQRSRGVEPAENPHTEILEAYGYRQLMELMMRIPSLGVKAVNLMGNTISSRIGLPGADAEDFMKKATQSNAARAKDMTKFIRENKSTDGINYVMISRGQEEHLPALLTDLPCIVLGSLSESDDHQHIELKPSSQQKQEL